jgi:hypothetical protein
MAKKSVLTLAKELGFRTKGEYFGYICDSYINGNKTQCRELFNDMRECDRKEFLRALKDDDYICIGHELSQKIFDFLY